MIKPPFDVRPGTLHKTNQCGTLIVKEYVSYEDIIVQFVRTGFVTHTRSDIIREGTVKDFLHPRVCGIGFMGVGKYSKVNNKKEYQTWRNMIIRCYDETCLRKRPSYRVCSVTEDWHNFQNFAQWYIDNYPVDCCDYQLDKDIKIEGNKVYGPDTCLFVSPTDNAIKAHAKHHIFKSPDGKIIEVYNLCKFCRENNLQQAHMWAVHSEKRPHHKGWTKA